MDFCSESSSGVEKSRMILERIEGVGVNGAGGAYTPPISLTFAVPACFRKSSSTKFFLLILALLKRAE
jgi:hypothetical protein